MESVVEPDATNIILHFDCDCFYAQVEELRDPSLRGKPLGVTQKYLIVTANYEARSLGVGKLMGIAESKKRVPTLTLINGEDLTPYRAASKRVASVIQRYGPVSKLGLDECFVDITTNVNNRLAELTPLEIEQLQWHGHVHRPASTQLIQDNRHRIGDLRAATSTNMNQSYDDDDYTTTTEPWVAKLKLGSALAAEIRMAIKHETGIRTSAGIACNKMLSKLVSGLHKPDDQTVLPPPQAYTFLSPLSVRLIPGVGYKMAQDLQTILNVSLISELVLVPRHVLHQHFGERIGTFLYDACRGIDPSPVVEQGLAKSVTVEDSFKSCKGHAAAYKVLQALAVDLSARLQEEAVENNRRASVLAVKWRRRGDGWKRTSASCTMPPTSIDDANVLAKAAADLLRRNVNEAAADFTLINIGGTNFVPMSSTNGGMQSSVLQMFNIKASSAAANDDTTTNAVNIEYRGHAPLPVGSIPVSKRDSRQQREGPIQIAQYNNGGGWEEEEEEEDLWGDLADVSTWKASSKRPLSSRATAAFQPAKRRLPTNTNSNTSTMHQVEPNKERVIIHCDIDSFYCAVERADDPSLMNVPLAVEQFNSGGFVAVSYEARAAGIRCGDGAGAAGRANIPHLRDMQAKSIAACRQQCPGLQVRPMRPDRYREASIQIEQVMEKVLSAISTGFIIERTSCDDFYIDVTKLLLGGDTINSRDSIPDGAQIYQDTSISTDLKQGAFIADRLKNAVFKEMNMTASCGVARNKLLARLTSPIHKPNGLTIMPDTAAAAYIQSLPIRTIPSLRGKQGATIITTLNNTVTTVGDLLQYTRQQLVQKLGESLGSWLSDIALGIDHAPVVKRGPQKTILVERSFPPTSTREAVGRDVLPQLVESLVNRLVNDGRIPNRLSVSWRQGYTSSDGTKASMKTRSREVPCELVQWIREQQTGGVEGVHRVCIDAVMGVLDVELGQQQPWELTRLALSVGYADGSSSDGHDQPGIRDFFTFSTAIAATCDNRAAINNESEQQPNKNKDQKTNNRAAAVTYRNEEAQKLQQLFTSNGGAAAYNTHEGTMSEEERASLELALKLQQEEAAAVGRHSTTAAKKKKPIGPLDAFLKPRAS